MYPDADEITIYRGTTSDELREGMPVLGEIAELSQNPISSWSLLVGAAVNFAQNYNGCVLKTTISKSDIWSFFASHAYHGNEREMIVLGREGRQAEVIWTLGSPEKPW